MWATRTRPAQPGEPLGWLGPAGQVGLAVLLAVVLLPTGIESVTDARPGTGWGASIIAALVVLHLTPMPPLVTRWPAVSFGLGSAVLLLLVTAPSLDGAMGGQVEWPLPPVLLPSSLVWFVLLYAVSARGMPPWPQLALMVGLVGCLLTSVRLWDEASADASPWGGTIGWRLFVLAAVLGGTLAAWSLGRFRSTRLAWQAATVERAAAAERRRIAREMHDVVAHSLAVVVAQAEGGRLLVQSQPERAAGLLEDIAGHGREALDQMRGLLGVLREQDTDAATPEPPQPSLSDVTALVDRMRATGRDVVVEAFGDPRPLSPVQGLTAYRVVQEGLTNVVKHAGAQATARVSIDWTDGLTVTVTDDGAGLAPNGHPGRGLVGMRERLDAVDGTLSYGPLPGGGWRTCARIPA